MSEFYTKPIQITNYSGIGYEADVLMVTKSGVVYEYEIKTSRADFKKDFTKVAKHKEYSSKTVKRNKRGYPPKPNHFYYVCKEGLIKKEEVPPYAGLIYIKGDKPTVVKKAPKLHKTKLPDLMVWNLAITLSTRIKYGCSWIRYKYNK